MEAVPNSIPGLFWGYTFIWAVISFYVVSIHRRVSRLERTLNGKD